MDNLLNAVSAGEVGVTAVCLAVLFLIARKVFPWLRQLVHFLDDITGEAARKGVPARPGLLERQESVEASLAVIEAAVKELRPNGGGSIKDHVNKLTQSAAIVEARVGDVASSMESLRSSYDEHVTRASATEIELRAAVAEIQHRVLG